MIDKILAWIRSCRIQRRLDFLGCPFIPKSWNRISPFNRQAYNEFIISARHWKLPDRPRILDVGANNGDFSLAFSTVYPNATVHLFEPIPNHVDRLRKLRSGGGFQWTIHPVALGETEEVMNIQVPIGQEAASSLHGFPSTYLTNNPCKEGFFAQTCEVKRLDDLDFVDTLPSRIDLMKIDVEGFEFAVLSGAQATLKMVDRVVVEVSRLRHSEEPGCPVARMVEKLSSFGLLLTQMEPTIFSSDDDSAPLEYDLYFQRYSANLNDAQS